MITRSLVISGLAKILATIDQISAGLASYGVVDFIRANRAVMHQLFTTDGAIHFLPTPESFLDGLKVVFSPEGSNAKTSEIDVYKYFCDYIQDLGTTEGISLTLHGINFRLSILYMDID